MLTHAQRNKKWYKKHSNYYQKNRIKFIAKTTKWHKNHPEKQKEASKKYNQSKKGKAYWKKHRDIRKRNLGWILMFENPFADSVEIDYHHILGAYVVAVPRNLHRLYCGKYHRENLRPILEQIYLGD